MRLTTMLLLLALAAPFAAPVGAEEEDAATPVLIELFTSEGCSSCPPADAYVAQLVRVQPIPNVEIVALSQHVDYWNSLGWEDPYSSPQFTKRQRTYSQRLRSTVYTPQLVIDGSEDFVGSDRSAVFTAIRRAARAPKAELDVSAENDGERTIRLEVRVGAVPDSLGGDLILWTALAENGLAVDVERGENRGLELKHDAVTRRLEENEPIAAGSTRSVTLRVDPAWRADRLRAVAFLQDAESGRIVGVAAGDVVTAGVE